MAAVDKQIIGENNVPARSAAAITPSNSVDLTYITRGIWVGVGGSIKVDMAESGTETFVVIAGTVLPIQAKRVYATGTTALSLIALW